MRVKLASLVTMGAASLVIMTACDNFAAYTVMNETNEELITWPFFEDCSVIVGNRSDYLHEEVVRPFERVDYHDIHGEPRDPKCVQVVTRDRQLVMAEQYEYGGDYTVSEPLPSSGHTIPSRNDLPQRSFAEMIRETPPATLVGFGLSFLFGLGILAAFLFAIFVILRFFYRFYVRKI